MARLRTPREAWIEEGLRVLGEAGVDAVRVEVIAQRLGVTKGGFYGYFADLPALLTEMLETWQREVTDHIIERIEADGDDARDRLRRWVRLASVGHSPGTGVTIDLAVREWARRDDEVARRMQTVDAKKLA